MMNVSWGRNGVEAINLVMKKMAKDVGRGVPFIVSETPIRGRT